MDNINWNELLRFLKDRTGLCYYNGSRTEMITRCYNCEQDSKKTHGHLYLKVDNGSPVFNCFKCEESGTIIKLIRNYGGDPSRFLDIKVLMDNWNTSNVPKGKDIFKSNYDLYDQNKDRFKLKIQYLKGRLGYDIDISEIPNLILDFDNFIYKNKIKLNTNQKNILPLLESNFVGFLTARGSQIVCRNIDETSSFKHYKLYLTEDQLVYKDFYGVTTSPIREGVNTVVLCEGTFDLLVPFFSPEFYDIRSKSCVWAAILNKKYDTSIQSVLDYCSISKANLIIFADKDVKYHDKILKNVRLHPQVKSVDFMWNTVGKDFGKHPIIPTKSSFTYKFFSGR